MGQEREVLLDAVPVAYNSRTQALEYTQKVNAVAGWRATTNAPESTRQPTAQPTANQSNSGYSRGNYSRSYNSRYDSRDLFGRPANYEDQFNAGATNSGFSRRIQIDTPPTRIGKRCAGLVCDDQRP